MVVDNGSRDRDTLRILKTLAAEPGRGSSGLMIRLTYNRRPSPTFDRTGRWRRLWPSILHLLSLAFG